MKTRNLRIAAIGFCVLLAASVFISSPQSASALDSSRAARAEELNAPHLIRAICSSSNALVTRTRDLAHTRTKFADELKSRRTQRTLLAARITALANSAAASRAQIKEIRRGAGPRYAAQLRGIGVALGRAETHLREISSRVANLPIGDRDNWAVSLRDLSNEKGYADGTAALSSFKKAAFTGPIGIRLKTLARREPLCDALLSSL
ncbi:unannotated protein [freshwater metagenome]|uniref:Unannotated protein n=1 Tax=freshwater metagenome TaxID=449393 RepID=A0A6J6K999_9ZZZZ|nr:hypothetical protein [Actinomycetota bacterium]